MAVPRPLGGRYAFVQRIRGTQRTIIWLARDVTTGGKVVASVLPGARAAGLAPSVGKQHENAASILEVLDAPPATQIPDDESLGEGARVVVADYVEGRSLQQRIDAGPVSIETAVEWVATVADALATLHAAGGVHGAVQPRSMIVVRPEDRTVPVLTHLLVPPSGAYCSPERVTGGGPSEADDVWALVATLYSALTRRTPFRGASRTELARAIVTGAPDALDDIDPLLSDIVDRGLAREPERRLSTAVGLRDALHDWQDETGRRSVGDFAPVEALIGFSEPAPLVGEMSLVAALVRPDTEEANAPLYIDRSFTEPPAPTSERSPISFEPSLFPPPSTSARPASVPAPALEPDTSPDDAAEVAALELSRDQERLRMVEAAPDARPPAMARVPRLPLPAAPHYPPRRTLDAKGASDAFAPTPFGPPVRDFGVELRQAPEPVVPSPVLLATTVPAPRHGGNVRDARTPVTAARDVTPSPTAPVAPTAPTPRAATEPPVAPPSTTAGTSGRRVAALVAALTTVAAVVIVGARSHADDTTRKTSTAQESPPSGVPGTGAHDEGAAANAAAVSATTAGAVPAETAGLAATGPSHADAAPAASAPAPSASAATPTTANAVPLEPASCIAATLPDGSLGPDAHASVICTERDVWTAARRFDLEVARTGKGAGMVQWAHLARFDLAAVGVLRHRCCPDAAPFTVATPRGLCDGLEASVTAVGTDPSAANVASYAEGVECLVAHGVRYPAEWWDRVAARDAQGYFERLVTTLRKP
jgi:serine/threonine-protein kinase